MVELWKTRQPGSISLTVNEETKTYYADAIEAESAAPKMPGSVELNDKPYYATGISFSVPTSKAEVIDLPDATISDNVAASQLVEIVGQTLVLQ